VIASLSGEDDFMHDVRAFVLDCIILIAAFAVPGWPFFALLNFKRNMRDQPAARRAFVGGGAWVGFSKRFGAPYVIGFIVLAAVWMVIFANLIPHTELGALILFGPSTIFIVLGCALGALRAARWMVEDS
jgi:hypothetical protein